MTNTSWFEDWIRRRDEALARMDEEFKATEPFSIGVADLAGYQHRPETIVELKKVIREISRREGGFFASPNGSGTFSLDGHVLTFTHPDLNYTCDTPARCDLYGSQSSQFATIVLPHWNARASKYSLMCRALARTGTLVAYLTLPFHGARRYDTLPVANEFVSANLGRTVAIVRECVRETRQLARWLQAGGKRSVSLAGISLGSCIAALTAAHDERINAAALMLPGGDFADVVWAGRATRHIRMELEFHISLEQLRSVWSTISPITYASQYSDSGIPLLLVSARYDTVIPSNDTSAFSTSIRKAGGKIDNLMLNCGHYTAGRFPYHLRAFWAVAHFLYRQRAVRAK